MILASVLKAFQGLQTGLQHSYQDGSPSCPINLPLSCGNETAISDLCCFEYPGGILLMTQFWNYAPSKPNLNRTELEEELGPVDSFTIHGLWPDDCMGGYPQFCKRDLFIDDVDYLLKSDAFNNDDTLPIQGEELLNNLNKYWKSNNGNHESLWIHEYNKHGTCLSTLQPQCYSRWNPTTSQKGPKYYKKKAVYDYFRISYDLFQKLNTYEMLAKHNITPSNDTIYTKSEILSALSSEFQGTQAHINCNSQNALTEVWYYHQLNGSILNEDFIPLDPLRSMSRCKDQGIKYYPKGYQRRDNRGPNKKPISRGTIRISQYGGFLIKTGRWMKRGTPANFELIESKYGNYLLKSRMGYCTVHNDKSQLDCSSRSPDYATQFDYNEEKGILGYSGSFEWGAESAPKNGRTSRSVVFAVSNEKNSNLKYKFQLKFNRK